MITKEEKRALMRFCGVKIRRDKQTNKFYWAQEPQNFLFIGTNKRYYFTDGQIYDTRTQAINAFINRAINPV